MSDSGIMKPEGIPIRNVQEYTTHSWRNWKRKNVYLVNVTFFRQEKVKQVYIFRKSATKFATFHSDKLLRESRRGLAIQNNTSYRNWCVLSNMLIVATSSNEQNAIFCAQVIETSGLSFISQDDLGNSKSNIYPDSVVVSFLTKNESQLRLPCDCLCDVYSVVFPIIGSPGMKKIIFDLKESLSIPKHSLPSFHRSKTSISDQRPEAVVMGSFAVMILILCVLLVFLLDIGKWRIEKRQMKRKTKESFRKG
ncbi:Hypothetical predicted protein [Mytilus galloprovincialis]|uniref:Uncharacterized protein n=1 Tax=Mytilus galloprovincialis TaxID=29158 RepID=A0A8B6C6Z9_MYTGA|nr:Hypothetical predicted protein [Mytilus galloprovincialis]